MEHQRRGGFGQSLGLVPPTCNNSLVRGLKRFPRRRFSGWSCMHESGVKAGGAIASDDAMKESGVRSSGTYSYLSFGAALFTASAKGLPLSN